MLVKTIRVQHSMPNQEALVYNAVPVQETLIQYAVPAQKTLNCLLYLFRKCWYSMLRGFRESFVHDIVAVHDFQFSDVVA